MSMYNRIKNEKQIEKFHTRPQGKIIWIFYIPRQIDRFKNLPIPKANLIFHINISIKPSLLFTTLSLLSHVLRRVSDPFSGDSIFQSKPSRWRENDKLVIMSVSYNDFRLSDLLCEEDYSGVLSADSPECSSDFDSLTDIEESSIGELIGEENNFIPGFDYVARVRSRTLEASSREQAVAWILKVHSYYGFQPLTAYLSVNYMDRFLHSRDLPQTNGWPMQLLSVACLSLAAKMEEPIVPSLLDLQIEGAKHLFQPRTVLRMELLVLSVLNWRLRSITPLSFISFFACKLDSTGACTGFLVSRATDIILSNLQETSLLEFRPSCIAAAAVVCAANEIPNLSLFNPENAESWCEGLIKEKIVSCYRLIQNVVLKNSKRKVPKVLPQFRVTTQTRIRSTTDESSSSSSTSSPSSYKRRKLNNSLWVDDDKGNSQHEDTE